MEGSSRRGVAFAGGGIVGGCYMLGVVEALNVALLDQEQQLSEGSQLRKSFFDIVEDRVGAEGVDALARPAVMEELLSGLEWDFYRKPDPFLSLFDTWQGISAGSVLASGCALRIPLTSQYLGMFKHAPNAFQGSDFFAFNYDQIGRMFLKLPSAMLEFVEELMYSPSRSLFEKSTTLLSTIPEGLLTGSRIEAFVHRLLDAHGKSDSFRDLPPGVRLFILASAINRAGEVVYFGEDPYRDVPISTAVRASCSLPVIDSVKMEEPGTGRPLVLKDGGLSRSINITYAFQQANLDFVIAINPIVPLRTDVALEFDNLLAMVESYYRILYYQRSYHYRRKNEELYRKYHGKFLLLEPDPKEWYFNLLNPYRRTESLVYGFEQTLLRLYNDYDEISKTLTAGQLCMRSRNVLRHHVTRISRRRRLRLAQDKRSMGKEVLRTLRKTYNRLVLGQKATPHRQF